MRNHNIYCLWLAGIIFSSLSAAVWADNCRLFEHGGYKGWVYEIATGRKINYVGDRYNDRISSVMVPSGCRLEVYRDVNFAGPSKTFWRNTPFVGNDFNDQISSASCQCQGSGDWGSGNDWGNHGWGAVQQCVFYQDAHYRGRQIAVPKNRQRGSLAHLNDQISSIRIPPGCEAVVYRDRHFRGASASISTSTTYIGDRMNDQISSVKCQCEPSRDHWENGWGAWKHQSSAYPKCQFYQHSNFRGRVYSLNANSSGQYVGDPVNDQISSIRIAPGCRAVVYEHAAMKGKSRTFYASQNYLSRKWNDRISSAACFCP